MIEPNKLKKMLTNAQIRLQQLNQMENPSTAQLLICETTIQLLQLVLEEN